MFKKTPITLKIFACILGFSIFLDIITLGRLQISTEYKLFNYYKLDYLFIALQIIHLATSTATIFAILKKTKEAYLFAWSSISVGLLNATISGFLMLSNTDIAKKLYIAHRIALKASVEENFVNFIFSPTGLLISTVFGLFYFGFLAYLIQNNRHFLDN